MYGLIVAGLALIVWAVILLIEVRAQLVNVNKILQVNTGLIRVMIDLWKTQGKYKGE